MSDENSRRRHGGIPPRPWHVKIYVNSPTTVIEDIECWGIYAADGTRVVETDSGYYPPDIETAEFICKCVNALSDSQAINVTIHGNCGALHHSFKEWQQCQTCEAILKSHT
jgi:hypothetical protein